MILQDSAWPVIVPRWNTIEIVDNQTLRRPCVACGVELDLAHLQDMDSYRLWYGGYCGKCGVEQDIELDDDTLWCRDCDTPLIYDSPDDDDADGRPMHCPQCQPNWPNWPPDK